MPIFDWKCDNNRCNNIIERIEKTGDPPMGMCPECLKGVMRKTTTFKGQFILKGDGFYNPSIGD